VQDLADLILKDCFWEYNFTKDDIYKLANSTDFKEKEFLFSKILTNATQMIKSVKIFTSDDLKELIASHWDQSFTFNLSTNLQKALNNIKNSFFPPI
jgi:hypothetical protein